MALEQNCITYYLFSGYSERDAVVLSVVWAKTSEELPVLLPDLFIEDTVDQEDEGSLLGVQDQEEDLQHFPVISEDTQNPGATKNHKLSQCFKHHNLGLLNLWNFSIETFESWVQTDDNVDEENRVCS